MSLTCLTCAPRCVWIRLTLSVKIIKAGFVIEIEDKRVLTEQQVRDFYYRIADQVSMLDANQKKLRCFQRQKIPVSLEPSF